MRSSTGAWGTGDDFVGRERELEVLGPLVRSFNHVLLTRQRRMGKTSIARELGRRLCGENWRFIFIDVEVAATVEDVIARFSKLVSDANERVDAILNILEHDVDRRVFFFPSRWLRDYWRIRYSATRSLHTG